MDDGFAPMEMAIVAVGALVPSIPVALVWLVGLGAAAVTYRRNGRRSLLVAAGLVVAGVTHLVGTPVMALLPISLVQSGSDPADIGTYVGVLAFGAGLANALAWGLVIAGALVVPAPEGSSSVPS